MSRVFWNFFLSPILPNNFFSFSFTAHIRNDDEKVGVVGYPNNDRHGDLHDQPCIIFPLCSSTKWIGNTPHKECNNTVDHRRGNNLEIQELWKSNGSKLCDAGMAVMAYSVTGLSVNRGF